MQPYKRLSERQPSQRAAHARYHGRSLSPRSLSIPVYQAGKSVRAQADGFRAERGEAIEILAARSRYDGRLFRRSQRPAGGFWMACSMPS